MVRRIPTRERVGRFVWTILSFLVLTMVSFIVILPLVWALSTSLRLPMRSFTLPPQWLPTEWRWQNYRDVFTAVPFGRYILNSFKVSASIVLAQVITSSMAAYAFARLRFPGKDFLFMLLMSSMMVPLFVTIIPVFILVRNLHLNDTHAALVVPATTSAFGTFLIRQFFMTIPRELEEAAKIDGATPWDIFIHIILPLGAPGISVLAILAFNGYWNEFFRPLIFLSSWEKFTIPLGLVTLRGTMESGSVSVVMAGVSMALVPVTLVFLFAQRYLIEGIALTGLKG
jgi:multiple sugar transport system permease protein